MIVRQQGHAPGRGKAVLIPQMCSEEMQEGTRACCLAFLGLLFLLFSRELAALIPYSAGTNLCSGSTEASSQFPHFRNGRSHGAQQTIC